MKIFKNDFDKLYEELGALNEDTVEDMPEVKTSLSFKDDLQNIKETFKSKSEKELKAL
jgi:hypothetical protein